MKFLKKLFGDIIELIRKWFVGLIVSIAAIPAAVLIIRFFDLSVPLPTKDDYLSTLSALYQNYILRALKALDYALSHDPLPTVLYASSFVIFLLSLYFAKLTVKKGMEQPFPLGLKMQYPDALGDATDPKWKYINASINDSKMLRILCLNGWATFGDPRSPLYEKISKVRKLEVILIRPSSDHFERRINGLGENVNNYKTDLSRTLQRLEQLKGKGKSVEIRYYNSKPNWKMFLTDECVWVQYYHPPESHVASTPIYMFSGKGAFSVFEAEFERIWDLCNKKNKRQ